MTAGVILGIDPGIERTGWGLIKKTGSNYRAVAYGCITTQASSSTGSRLADIYLQLTKIIKQHQPTIAAVEQLFHSRNVKTAMMVGQARGVVMLALSQASVEASELNPMTVKLAVSGYGAATKNQVQKLVQTQLKLDQIPKPDDAADALAIALALTTMGDRIIQ